MQNSGIATGAGLMCECLVTDRRGFDIEAGLMLKHLPCLSTDDERGKNDIGALVRLVNGLVDIGAAFHVIGGRKSGENASGRLGDFTGNCSKEIEIRYAEFVISIVIFARLCELNLPAFDLVCDRERLNPVVLPPAFIARLPIELSPIVPVYGTLNNPRFQSREMIPHNDVMSRAGSCPPPT
jgi:hypothetical protein